MINYMYMSLAAEVGCTLTHSLSISFFVSSLSLSVCLFVCLYLLDPLEPRISSCFCSLALGFSSHTTFSCHLSILTLDSFLIPLQALVVFWRRRWWRSDWRVSESAPWSRRVLRKLPNTARVAKPKLEV